MSTAAAHALALGNLLAWLDAAPRSNGETMEAWRSSCPRMSAWEDALLDGLVTVPPHDGPAGEARVVLTVRGRAALAATAS